MINRHPILSSGPRDIADEIRPSVILQNCRQVIVARSIDLNIDVFRLVLKNSVAHDAADDQRSQATAVGMQRSHERAGNGDPQRVMVDMPGRPSSRRPAA